MSRSDVSQTTADERLRMDVIRLVAWLDSMDAILPDDHSLVGVPATMLRDLRKWVDRNV